MKYEQIWIRNTSLPSLIWSKWTVYNCSALKNQESFNIAWKVVSEWSLVLNEKRYWSFLQCNSIGTPLDIKNFIRSHFSSDRCWWGDHGLKRGVTRSNMCAVIVLENNLLCKDASKFQLPTCYNWLSNWRGSLNRGIRLT